MESAPKGLSPPRARFGCRGPHRSSSFTTRTIGVTNQRAGPSSIEKCELRARSRDAYIGTLVRKIARVCVGKQDVCELFVIFGTNAMATKYLNSASRRGWFLRWIAEYYSAKSLSLARVYDTRELCPDTFFSVEKYISNSPSIYSFCHRSICKSTS